MQPLLKRMTNYLDRFNLALNSTICKYFQEKNDLNEACKYALSTGGKRIRPLLCYFSNEIFNIDLAIVDKLAVCIEFIHTYSLVHDDLPCMDNDDFRRGKLSVHKKFGETVGLLCGDSLLNTAFEIALECIKKYPETVDSFMRIFKYAGIRYMIGGQYKEYENLDKTLEKDDFLDIYNKKTGGLITAAIMAPALDKDADDLMKFAYCFGLCFQLSDDILDIEKNGEKSYATTYGFDKTKELLDMVYNNGLECLDRIKGNTNSLRELFVSVKDRNK